MVMMDPHFGLIVFIGSLLPLSTNGVAQIKISLYTAQ